ncbi:MAG: hypothetical protein BAA01_00970 [Bacillus thermozeamaize]|jgi:hypothetical protein|uniref:ATP-grasp domain-containing protein n=1 Tax=Bacillus thermozeamaize TaxID=230954 RepID=A0A1Y3PAR7_9BACI|nr:MAG: hypothetical protein BAA01_00970 [Bacillus thermozeamaize]
MDVTVKRREENGNQCLLSADLFEALELVENKKYTLHVGHSNATVTFKKRQGKISRLSLPHTIFEQLHLLHGMKLNIWKAGDAIYLGPVVGIFVNPTYITNLSKGNIPLTAKKDIQANAVAKCLIYFFSTDHIDWKAKTIQGYTVAPQSNQWTSQTCPFPNVIYDCGVHFPTDQKGKVKRIRQRFREDPGIQFINNSDYLGKWALYTKLSKYKEMRPYLPETIRYQSVEDLHTMLAKHPLVYVKSFYGSRGREVMTVRKTENGYVIKFYHGVLKSTFVKRFDQIVHLINRFFGDKPLILQEGINVLTYKGRRLDFRLLICKNGSGQWQVIYNQANVAKPGATITTIGKNYKNYDQVYRYFQKTGQCNSMPTDKKLRKETIKIAQYIEKEFGPHGEIGMDMAVDRNGKIWFIEANAKPEKLPIPGLEDTKGVSPQFLSTFQYATFLTKKACGAL